MIVCLSVYMYAVCYSVENEGCVALNLSRIEDMQTRMRSNLEAIGMLNQQVRDAHVYTHARS